LLQTRVLLFCAQGHWILQSFHALCFRVPFHEFSSWCGILRLLLCFDAFGLLLYHLRLLYRAQWVDDRVHHGNFGSLSCYKEVRKPWANKMTGSKTFNLLYWVGREVIRIGYQK
jgi:hypothetical protein